MLIDSRIDQLRDVLHNTKDTMVGRSVASVRSPVRNLSAVNPAVTHEQFCNAIVEAFVEQYSVNDKVVHIGEEDLKAQKYAAERAFVENSIIELESWEWKYGQTLEFTHSISGNIEGRSMHAEIKAKHGIITECGISYDASQSPDENESLSSLSSRLIGKRYGFLDLDDIADGQPERKVLQWLQNEM